MADNRAPGRTRVKKLNNQMELQEAFSIRLRVFVAEQGVPREVELDADDKKATHFLAYVRERAVGTTRLVFSRREAKIGRMAVLKRYRGKGVGKLLLRRAVRWAGKSGAKAVSLHAQVPVIGFYEKMGFRCVGRSFMEAGIPHRKMVLSEGQTQKH